MIRDLLASLPPIGFSRLGYAVHARTFAETPTAAGKVAVVTGASSGIGYQVARRLAGEGARVHLVCRDEARGAGAMRQIRAASPGAELELHVADLAEPRAIAAAASKLRTGRIDVLVHNAGALSPECTLTSSGLEATFATQVLGPFLLTRMLGESLGLSPDPRVVFVSSGGMYLARLDVHALAVPPRYDGVRVYANAKRAQVVLAQVLAERQSPSSFYASMHPGWVDTNGLEKGLPGFHRLMRPLLRDLHEGADTILWLASADLRHAPNGAFWFDRRVAPRYLWPSTSEGERDREDLFELLVALEKEAET